MRFKLAIVTAATLGIAACGERESAADNGIVSDQGFSVENSAANDVTAIDAATSDAAGMAADTEANLVLDDFGNNSADANSAQTTPANNSADDE
jgi:hypothetical protein